MTNQFDIREWRMQQALKELEELSAKQQKIAKAAPPEDKITGDDFKALRSMKEQPAYLPHDAENLEEDNYSLTEDDWQQKDDESEMAHSQLYAVKDLADKLCSMIDDGEQLDAWVQAKLTKAEDYLDSVYHYLSGEEATMDREEEPMMPRLQAPKDNVIFGAQFNERRGDTDYRRAKAAKRFGKKGEQNTFGAGVAKGEKIEKNRLRK
jgi:hypothetical protein